MTEFIPPKRTSFTKKQREEAFAKTEGLCSRDDCNRPAEDIDHILPVALGGAHSIENWEPLCKVHHKIKTAEDIKRIRKADRAAGRKGQHARREKNGSKLKSAKKVWPKRSFPKVQKKFGT